MSAYKPTTPVLLVCQSCGTQTTIQRRYGRLHKAGHVKHLWCITCKERTAHTDYGKYGLVEIG